MSVAAMAARLFPVDAATLTGAIDRLRCTRDGTPIPLSAEQARAVLNALANLESKLQDAEASR